MDFQNTNVSLWTTVAIQATLEIFPEAHIETKLETIAEHFSVVLNGSFFGNFLKKTHAVIDFVRELKKDVRIVQRKNLMSASGNFLL